jgi:hypothetical protein
MRRISLIIAVLILSRFSSNAQFSAGGGYSIYKSLNSTATWQGINGFVEFPRTESNTFFLRMTMMLPQRNTNNLSLFATAFELSTSPQQIPVDVEQISRTSFISIDGGNRTFFMNTYDAGVAPYFASHARGILGSARQSNVVSNFDDTQYQSPFAEADTKASSVFVGMGVNFGVKYQLPYRGALLFDLGVEYVLALYDAAEFMFYGEITPISFFANLSYRFDWY